MTTFVEDGHTPIKRPNASFCHIHYYFLPVFFLSCVYVSIPVFRYVIFFLFIFIDFTSAKQLILPTQTLVSVTNSAQLNCGSTSMHQYFVVVVVVFFSVSILLLFISFTKPSDFISFCSVLLFILREKENNNNNNSTHFYCFFPTSSCFWLTIHRHVSLAFSELSLTNDIIIIIESIGNPNRFHIFMVYTQFPWLYNLCSSMVWCRCAGRTAKRERERVVYGFFVRCVFSSNSRARDWETRYWEREGEREPFVNYKLMMSVLVASMLLPIFSTIFVFPT